MKGVFKITNFDLAIIGAGPIGLFAANYAQLHNLKTVLIDTLDEVGGQPIKLYPFKNIQDIPAYQNINASTLINNLKIGIDNKLTKIILNHTVSQLQTNQNGFLIDEEIQVKSVLIATGNGAFKPKKLPIEVNSELEKHIHYFIKNPEIYQNKEIGILGGGDSALDYANEISKYAKVKLIHRRPQFRGLESSLKKLEDNANVEILTPYLPKTITSENNKICIGLKEVGSDSIKNTYFDELIVAYGFKANNRFARKWGIQFDGSNIAVNPTMKTNISGIYAVGDAIKYDGRVPLIGVGFGEVQIAITSIMRDLFPEKTLTIHSTSL